MRKRAMAHYSVEFPNEPAVHAKLTRILIKEKVPFKSMLTIRVGDSATIQFLAPKDNTMRAKLEKMGIPLREEQVFELEIPHQPYELHKLASTLAGGGINIVRLYSKVVGGHMRIVLAVDQTADAMALIRKLGFDPFYPVYQ